MEGKEFSPKPDYTSMDDKALEKALAFLEKDVFRGILNESITEEDAKSKIESTIKELTGLTATADVSFSTENGHHSPMKMVHVWVVNPKTNTEVML